MTLLDVQTYYKTGYQFQKITGLSHTNWNNWRRAGYIPIQAQFRIEQLTKGDLKADVKHGRQYVD